MVHLWHKHEAESQGGAEYYEHRDEHEGGVPLLLQDGWDGHTQHAHDNHVIEAHAHILHVARGKYVTTAEARGQTFRIDNEDPRGSDSSWPPTHVWNSDKSVPDSVGL